MNQWVIILIQILVPLGFGCIALLRGQDTSWDIQNYHLYNPYALLHHRLNFDLLPSGEETYYNPYIDLVYFLGIKYLAPCVLGFLIGFLQGLNFVVLFHIYKSCLKAIDEKYARWAVLLAFLGIFSVGFLSEVGTVYWDSLVSLFPLISLLIIVKFMDSLVSGRGRALFTVVLAGMMAGIGGGLKLIAIPYAFSLFLSFFIISMPWKRKLIIAALFGGGALFGFLSIDGLWLWNVWHLTGNPIFPRMNQIFHGELAPFTSILDARFFPRNIIEGIFYPVVFTLNPFRVGEEAFRQISWLSVYLFSLVFLLSKAFQFFGMKKKSLMRSEIKYLLFFFWISFFLWMNIFGVYRYLIAIEILIPLILFVLLLNMLEVSFLTPAIVVVMIEFFTLFNINGIPDWGHSNWGAKVYRMENTWVQKEKIDLVLLMDKPLAWVVPALDIQAPFAQVVPGFSVNASYANRVKSMISKVRQGKILVIFQPWVISLDKVNDVLKAYNLVLTMNNCFVKKVYLGTEPFYFVFCLAQNPLPMPVHSLR